MRLRIDLAYDGTDFCGWASQPGLRTVCGTVEEWITRILRLPEPARLTVAGRTDSGVHARGQVCHVDLDDVDPDYLLRRLQRAVPADIAVRNVTLAPDGFDARFSAVWRRYVYRLADAAVPADPLTRNHVASWPVVLDVVAMNTAAQLLLGLRDFVAVCKQREGATTIRTLLDCDSVRTASGVIETTVRADAFCHSMVRSMMGALVSVGSGRRDCAWLEQTMAAGVRGGDIPVMAACGLTLEEVGYPPNDQLSRRAEEARNTRSADELG